MVAVVFAAVLGVLPLKTAFADNDDRRDNRQYQNQGRHENQSRRRQYHRYPVYVPRPVYRPRYESPGIRLIIPIEIR
jgi:hypothetical protein